MIDLTNFDFSLKWPEELFTWEAKRIIDLRSSDSTADTVASLFAEAFEDGDIASTLEWGKYTTSASGTDVATEVVNALLSNPDILHANEATPYWLERQFGIEGVPRRVTLAAAFVELIHDFQELGYFPKILPKSCIDDPSTHHIDPSHSISRAIHYDVSWPLDESSLHTRRHPILSHRILP